MSVARLRPDDGPELIAVDQWAFGGTEEDNASDELAALDWDRTTGMWRDGTDGTPRRLVGAAVALPVDLPVPGGAVPCAGVTWVGVHPQFRRRGILRALMSDQLHDIHRRGREPVAALFAAEEAIYGRFGYGVATRALRLTVPRGAELRKVAGADGIEVALERVDADRHTDLIGDCHDRVSRSRPGMVRRTSPQLRKLALADRPRDRRDAESLRVALAVDAGTDPGTGPLRGYALFRRKAAWTRHVPDGTVQVGEFVADDAATARALWGVLTDLDLTARVETGPQPVDDPLLHLLINVRAASPRLVDGLWVRLVDVPAALAGRRYATEVDTVLSVEDPVCPWNRGNWRLRGGPDGAECTPTEDPPDLDVGVGELGSAYLGGIGLAELAAAGRITERTPGSAAAAGIAFGWPVAPHSSWQF
jgi:predicted acetyltransferase